MPKATKTGASHHLRPGALDPRNRPEVLPKGVRYTSEGRKVNPHRNRTDVKPAERAADGLENEPIPEDANQDQKRSAARRRAF